MISIANGLGKSASWLTGGRKNVSGWTGVNTVVSRGVTRVTEVDWSRCNLVGVVPECLRELGELRSLNMQENKIASFPEGVVGCGELRKIVLHNNPKMHGRIPCGIAGLKNLERLYLHNTKIRAGRVCLNGLQRCRQFGEGLVRDEVVWLLEGLGLVGEVRGGYYGGRGKGKVEGLMKVLKHDSVLARVLSYLCTDYGAARDRLVVEGAWRKMGGKEGQVRFGRGRDVRWWKGVKTSCGRVEEIVWADLGLIGSIPKELGMLSELKYLSLNGNKLEGELPEELCAMKQLGYLNLHQNR